MSRPAIRGSPAGTGCWSAVREALLAGDRAVVQALHGMGGVGKTQLAIEYAHRFAGAYDLVWWVDAEQAGLIGDQFAALGAELGCAEPGGRRVAAAPVRCWPSCGSGAGGCWSSITPSGPQEWAVAAGRGGHVLITSRAAATGPRSRCRWRWTCWPGPNRWRSCATGCPDWREADAGRVAQALGDLPLALAQAAGYMPGTGMPAGEYLELLAARAAQVLDQGTSAAYRRSLAAVTQLAFDRLRAQDPIAASLAAVCAFLAPEPVPTDWFPRAATRLSQPLAEAGADPLAWRQVLALVRQQALARLDQHGLVMHRLTQAIIRGYLPPDQAAETRQWAAALLAANHPGDQQLPATWPGWARLLPHLLALDPQATTEALSDLTVDAIWYLIRRGDARSGYDLANRTYQHRLGTLGPEDPGTLATARALAAVLRALGRYGQARDLDEDALARRRRVLGDEHPDTLAMAHGLAIDLRSLGEHQAARELNEDTLGRYRRVLGDDHPDTLASATGLAIDLMALGEHQAARELGEDALARYRRVLGDDHPDTLISANNLANDLRALGEYQAARELDEDTLARRRRVLGDDHPDTLASANNLANDLRALGEHQAARELNEDALARYRRVLGDDHPSTLISANNLAIDLRALGEHQAARELNEDTLARRRRVLGDDHPSTLTSANNLADDLRALGEARVEPVDESG